MSAQLNIDALRNSFQSLDTNSQLSDEFRLSQRNFILLGGATAVAGSSILRSLDALEVIGV